MPRVELRNAQLTSWMRGRETAPDGWVLGGPGSGTVRAGPAVPGEPGFGAQVSSAMGDLALYQDARVDRRAWGHSVSLNAWVKVSRPAAAQLTIRAGPQVFASAWHPGTGDWQLLTAAGIVPEGVSSLRFHAWARNGSTTEVGAFSASIDPAPARGLRNPGLTAWGIGELGPPDGWTFGGPGSGSIHRGPAGPPGAASGATVTGSRGDVALYQDLDARALRGHRFRFATWVRASAPEAAQLAVSDGSAWFASTWHSGTGNWELLTATGTVSDGAASVRFHVWARGASAIEIGGSSLSFEPAPRTPGRAVVLGSLGLALALGLLLASSRRPIGALTAMLRGAPPDAAPGPWTRRLTPERFLLVAGSVFGLSFLVLTPPLQAPDEPAHFIRAFAVSEGHLLPEVRIVNGKQVAGAQVPKSFFRLQDDTESAEIPFHPERKFDPAIALGALSAPLRADDRAFHDFGAPAMYAPVPYMPQALGILVGTAAGLSPLGLLYLARLANLLCWLGGMWVALRVAPGFKWVFALLALSPMSVFLAGSASPDVCTNWLSFLTVAAFLDAAFHRDAPLTRMDVGRLLVACFLLSLCKQVYLVLSLLLLLVPARKLGGAWRYSLAFVGLVSIQVGANLLWWYLAIKGHPAVRGGSNPAAQVAFALSDPLRMVGIFLRTQREYAYFYLSSFVGNLGWLDVSLPPWVIYSYLLVAFTTSAFYGLRQGTLSRRHRALLLLVAATVWSMILGYHYLIWSKVGADTIDGGMGRYLIPLAPLVFLAFSGGRASPDAEPIKVRLALFTLLVLGTALAYTMERYYQL